MDGEKRLKLYYNFAIESQDAEDLGVDVEALLRECPFVKPVGDGRLGIDGDEQRIVMAGSEQRVLGFYAYCSIAEGDNFDKQAAMEHYKHVKRLYDWLLAVTPYDWELYTEYEDRDMPYRFRPSMTHAEPDLPYEDEEPFVLDAAAVGNAGAGAATPSG